MIQAPGNAQNHNRYSYVLNNPLSYSDPSGFSWWTKWRSTVFSRIAYVITFIVTSGCELCAQVVASAIKAGMDAHQAGTNIGRAMFTAGLGTFLGGRVLGGAITTALNGGNRNQIGAALASGIVGEALGASGMNPIAATAASGCISALVSGGNCGRGAGDALTGMAINMAVQAAEAGIKYAVEAYKNSQSGEEPVNAPGGRFGRTRAGPSGPLENGLPAVFTVNRDGRNVNITIPIEFYGSGNNAENRANIVSGIENYWSGTFGSGDQEVMVTVRVITATQGQDTNYLHISPASENTIPAALGAPGVWRCEMCRGGWVSSQASPENMQWIAAHEIGHLFGLRDRVTNQIVNGARVSTSLPDYENNIMGSNYFTRPSANDIRCIGTRNCN